MIDTRRSDVLRRLGDELRVLREKAGLTAEQATHRAGVLAGTVVQ